MTPKTLVSGGSDLEDAKFSPDGKWVSFVRDFNLWIVSAAGGDASALTTGGSEEILKGKLDWVYPEELNLSTAYWWSPDSSKIAYYQMDERPVTRYPIVDMSSPAGSIEYTRFPQAGEAESRSSASESCPSLAAPQSGWTRERIPTSISPASTGCATAAASPSSASTARRTGSTCSFAMSPPERRKRVLDRNRQILDQHQRRSLFFRRLAKRFLWSSERTGFRHYYPYDLSRARALTQLTSGDWGITGTSGFGPGGGASRGG